MPRVRTGNMHNEKNIIITCVAVYLSLVWLFYVNQNETASGALFLEMDQVGKKRTIRYVFIMSKLHFLSLKLYQWRRRFTLSFTHLHDVKIILSSTLYYSFENGRNYCHYHHHHNVEQRWAVWALGVLFWLSFVIHF